MLSDAESMLVLFIKYYLNQCVNQEVFQPDLYTAWYISISVV